MKKLLNTLLLLSVFGFLSGVLLAHWEILQQPLPHPVYAAMCQPTPTVLIGNLSPTTTPATQEAMVAQVDQSNASNGLKNAPSPIIYGSGATTQAPSAVTCNIPFSSPILNGFVANGNGVITLSWLESDQNIDKYSVIYGYSPDSLVYGKDNIHTLQTDIGDLSIGKSVWVQVWAWKNGCAEKSNIFDPIVL